MTFWITFWKIPLVGTRRSGLEAENATAVIEPPPSLPNSKGDKPAATAAAPPPVRSRDSLLALPNTAPLV